MARVLTVPKEGAVKVAKTAGWVATVSGTPLPPVRPERMRLVGVAAVGLGAGRAGRGAAVAAGFVDNPVGHAEGGHRAQQFAGAWVDDPEISVSPDGVGASGGRADVIEPAEVAVTRPGQERRGRTMARTCRKR